MKFLKSSGVIIIAILVVAGIVFLLTKNHKPISQTKKTISPTQTPTISVVPTLTTAPTVEVSPMSSQYSIAIKAKVRNEFIDNCNTIGHYSISICTCAADYLKKNYSETELAKIYVQYHTSSQIPGAVVTSISTCSGK